jgi:hypothetical protein
MYVPEGLATASNPKAPAIWLVHITVDAQPLESIAGAAGEGAAPATTTGSFPILMEGYATPAWLCVQTWLPRASDFKAKGFLDAYPYYYYFRGHPKVAEFFVRLHNMEEWTDLWIERSVETTISETRLVLVQTSPDQPPEIQEETYNDWGINFVIQAKWNPDNAIWGAAQAEGEQAVEGGGQ